MFQYMTTQAILVLLAFCFLIALIIIAGVIGHIRRRDPNFTPPPVRFVPHWQMMSMLGLALLAILAAILVPFILRLLSP
jgi:uncharacterized iron-regulated membrane protein